MRSKMVPSIGEAAPVLLTLPISSWSKKQRTGMWGPGFGRQREHRLQSQETRQEIVKT